MVICLIQFISTKIPHSINESKWWEYGGGCYHVTIKTKNGVCYFGHIARNAENHQNEMIFSKLGEFVNDEIPKMMDHYWYVNIPKWVVMPNHVHIIVVIDARGRGADNIGHKINNDIVCETPDKINNDVVCDVNKIQCSRDVPRNVSTSTALITACAPKIIDHSQPFDNNASLNAQPAENTQFDIVDRRTPELMSSISPKTGSLSLVIRQFKHAVTMYVRRNQSIALNLVFA